MQNCLLYLGARFYKLLEEANKYAPNFSSHLEKNSLIYHLFFGELLEMPLHIYIFYANP
jgi:hypothetical protein